jgi:hypothetical protein
MTSVFSRSSALCNDCLVTKDYKKYKNMNTTKNVACIESSSTYLKKKVYNTVNCDEKCVTKTSDLLKFYGNYAKTLDVIQVNIGYNPCDSLTNQETPSDEVLVYNGEYIPLQETTVIDDYGYSVEDIAIDNYNIGGQGVEYENNEESEVNTNSFINPLKRDVDEELEPGLYSELEPGLYSDLEEDKEEIQEVNQRLNNIYDRYHNKRGEFILANNGYKNGNETTYMVRIQFRVESSVLKIRSDSAKYIIGHKLKEDLSGAYDSEESVTVPVAYNNNSPGHNIYNLYIYVPEAY